MALTERSGVDLSGQVLYELHIGTFTREGTLPRPIEQIGYLAEVGVTMIEVMPVAEFAGSSAGATTASTFSRPTRSVRHAGRFPPLCRRGPSRRTRRDPGRGLQPFRPGRQLHRPVFRRLPLQTASTEWGEADQLRRRRCRPVREFFIANAGYWIDEFHIDGLRMDAVQAIIDDSPEHRRWRRSCAASARRQAAQHAGIRRKRIAGQADDLRPTIRAATGSTRPGTTTSIMPPAWP